MDAPVERQKIFYEDLEDKTRTSTPLPGTIVFNNSSDDKVTYNSWKRHLHDPSKRFKVRGAHHIPDAISGHITRVETSNNTQNDDLPDLNKEFIQLLLNQPNAEDLISIEDYNIPLCKHSSWITNKDLICNCNKYSGQNVDLPIGYFLNEDGLVVKKHYKKYNLITRRQCSLLN